MNTLILNGTPNSNNYPVINILTEHLTSEYKIIDLYSFEMSQIVDPDTSVDKYIETCNAVIMISPIIFGTLSGRLIDFASRYIDTPLSFASKSGSVIFVGNNKDIAYASETAKRILNCFNVQEIFPDVIVDYEKNNDLLSMINWINSKSGSIVSDTTRQASKVTKLSSPQDKINLFRSLFKGREDVYALRWYNSKTEKSGYSPVCSNKWFPGVCNMPKVKCAECNYRSYTRLDDKCLCAGHGSGTAVSDCTIRQTSGASYRTCHCQNNRHFQ